MNSSNFGGEVSIGNDSDIIAEFEEQFTIDEESSQNSEQPNLSMESTVEVSMAQKSSTPNSKEKAPKEDNDLPVILRALNTFYDPANSILRHKDKYKPFCKRFQDRYGLCSDSTKAKEPGIFCMEGLKTVLPLLNAPEGKVDEEHKYYRVLSDDLWKSGDDGNVGVDDSEIESREVTCNSARNYESEDDAVNDAEIVNIDPSFEHRRQSAFSASMDVSFKSTYSTENSFYDDKIDPIDEEAKEPRFLRTVMEQTPRSRLVIKDKATTTQLDGTNDVSMSAPTNVRDENIEKTVEENQPCGDDEWNEDCLDFEPFSP